MVIASRKNVAFIAGLPLERLDGLVRCHARPPRGPRASESTKTDQTLGRSVALLAQLHPKCPFQVEASARPSVVDVCH
jgi:hypothetical protein